MNNNSKRSTQTYTTDIKPVSQPSMTGPIAGTEAEPLTFAFKNLCDNLEFILSQKDYTRIRILLCGTVTEDDIDKLTQAFARMSASDKMSEPAELKVLKDRVKGAKEVKEVKESQQSGFESAEDPQKNATLGNIVGDRKGDKLRSSNCRRYSYSGSKK